MRLRSALITIMILACVAAGLADAAPKGRVTLVVPPKPASARGLRGPIGVAPVARPINPVALRGLPPLRGLAAPPPDAGQCRLSCAHSYYLCLSDQDNAPDCPQTWSSCVVECDRPSASSRVSPST